MSDTSGVPESGVVFFKGGGHSHDGVNSSPINTSSYSIFDFSLSIATGVNDTNREYTRSVNQQTFNQYISNFITSQVFQPAGIVLAENSVRGINIGADEITADKIAANTITANELSSEIILVNNTIKSNNYVANTSGWAVFSNGFAEFMDADINGAIVANTGNIGGFTISSNTISAGSGASYIALQSNTSTNAYVIWAGNTTASSAPFSVRNNGFILANSGNVGGWTITSTYIGAGFTALYSNGHILASLPNIVTPTISSGGGGTIGGITIGSGNLSYGSGVFSDSISVYTGGQGAILDGTNLNVRFMRSSANVGTIAAAAGTLAATCLRYSAGEHYFPTASFFVIEPTAGGTTGLFATLGTGSGTAVVATTGNQIVKQTSRRALKYDISPVSNSINKLKLLNPVNFKWRINKNSSDLALFLKDNDIKYGFIVEEVEEIDPSLINYAYVGPTNLPDDEKFNDPNNFEPESYDTNGIISILTAALKEAISRIEHLESLNGV